MIFDEYGRPFIILREQQAQARIRGKEAQKVNNMDCRRKQISGQPAQPTAAGYAPRTGFLIPPCPADLSTMPDVR